MQDNGNLFEKTMKENFPNLVKEIDMQVQEAQRVPNKMDAKRPTPRHIIIKISNIKDKERILKAARENKSPNFAMYNALLCITCTHLFCPSFQEKKPFISFFNSILYLYLETKATIVFQGIILHTDIVIAF